MPQTLPDLTLSQDALDFVQRKVSAGEYATASDVLNDAVAKLQAEDNALEQWLHEVAVPAYERYKADPSRGLTLDQIQKELEVARRARYEAR